MNDVEALVMAQTDECAYENGRFGPDFFAYPCGLTVGIEVVQDAPHELIHMIQIGHRIHHGLNHDKHGSKWVPVIGQSDVYEIDSKAMATYFWICPDQMTKPKVLGEYEVLR